MELDARTLQIVSSKSQADKAISSLKGILLGINFDSEVNENEITELECWARLHKELVLRNPFKEFMTIIENTLSNNIPRIEAIEDLYWLCQKYEGENYYYSGITTDLQTLQGLCHGILADGIINDKEIFALNNWLEENTHLSTYYPYDEIRSLIRSIVADGKITEDEKLILKAYFSQFVNLRNSKIKRQLQLETSDINIFGLCANDPSIIFKDRTFCITGVLKRESRGTLRSKIIQLGGIPVDNLSKKTDYLIVGDNGNPAWAFSCYGRKVEKAINMRKDGHNIVLVHEFDFGDIVDDKLYS